MKRYVYLCGPITGLTLQGASSWREKVKAALDSDKVETLDPLRGKDYLLGVGAIHSGEYPNPLSTAKGITRRDMYDTLRSDIVFSNLLGTERVSIGSVAELAWAYQAQKIVGLIMEDKNIHDHSFVREMATFVVSTIEEGVELVKRVLNEKQKPAVSRTEHEQES